MIKQSINFRNFCNVNACLSYYANGNVCLKIYAGNMLLCELSKDIGIQISKRVLILKDTLHTDQIINELMSAGLITAFQYNKKQGYVCNLSYKTYIEMQKEDSYILAATPM